MFPDDRFFKMAFVVNSALHMDVGSIAATVAEAGIMLYRLATENSMPGGRNDLPELLDKWEDHGSKKAVFRGVNHLHLEAIEEDASRMGLESVLLTTDRDPLLGADGNVAAVCIFGDEVVVDAVTGDLEKL